MNALGTLLRFRLRRDRVRVVVWVLVLALSALFVAAALAKTYNTESLRVGVLKLLSLDPTLLALRGAPDGASAGAFFMVEIGSYLALLIAFMNSFSAVRHTRADEESGRSELIAATRAGRGSSTVATVIHAAALNVLVGLFTALAMMAAGFDAAGSLTLGWALACAGIAFFGIGLLTAQIFSTSRAANGWGSAIIGAAWVLNAAGNAAGTTAPDGLHVEPGAAVWFSPIGWALRTRPFSANDWLPGLIGIAFAAVLITVAFALQGNRDTAAGLVAARNGRPWASAALRGPGGLAWRLQRGSIIGWGVGAIIGAAAVGGLGGTLKDAMEKNPQLATAVKAMGSGQGTVFESFLGIMMALIGLVVAGAAIQTMMRMRQEETAGTAELVLATGVSRLRWYLSYVVVALVASAVILALSGLVAGSALASIDARLVWQATALALAQLPAVGVYLAITALAFAVVPPATIPVGWALFGFGIVFGEFGGLLGLPDWVRSLAPTTHTAVAPLATADWSGTWVMSLLALVLLGVGATAFRARNVTTA
jgi:ABC-2 type transport system permease protein